MLVPAQALGAAQAELVALWVCQDEPVLDTLADVHLPRAQGEQPAELGRLIAMDRFDVKVQPVLGEFRPVRHEPEVDLERATVGPDRHAVATALHHLPAKCPGPNCASSSASAASTTREAIRFSTCTW
jgi:hypothetical protein